MEETFEEYVYDSDEFGNACCKHCKFYGVNDIKECLRLSINPDLCLKTEMEQNVLHGKRKFVPINIERFFCSHFVEVKDGK